MCETLLCVTRKCIHSFGTALTQHIRQNHFSFPNERTGNIRWGEDSFSLFLFLCLFPSEETVRSIYESTVCSVFGFAFYNKLFSPSMRVSTFEYLWISMRVQFVSSRLINVHNILDGRAACVWHCIGIVCCRLLCVWQRQLAAPNCD